jgi:hypothetical protein
MNESRTNFDWRLWLLLTAIALGFSARIALWSVSIGTNDALTWGKIGRSILNDGLLKTYREQPDCNQPPGQPLLAAAAYQLAKSTKTLFSNWFKAPMVLADVLTAVLIWLILRRRKGPHFAAAVTALYAWSPIAILISAHHANGEPLYVAFSLLAVWLIEDRRRVLVGALALGAAINFKLVPILLIAPLLATFDNRKDAGRFLGGLAMMAVPSLIILLLEPQGFWQRVVAYNPAPEHWGISYFLLEAGEVAQWARSSERAVLWYNDHGTKILLASIVLISLLQWRTQWWDRYSLCALAFTAFLIFTPGFGPQYLAAPVALLLLAAPRVGVLYNAVGGAFLLVSYLLRWDGTFPIKTFFEREFNFLPGRTFGMLAWAVLCIAAWHLIARPRNLSSIDR